MNNLVIPILIGIIWAPGDNRVPLPAPREIKGEVAPKPAPIVTVYGTPGCAACLRIRRDVKGDCRDRDWRFVTHLHSKQQKPIQDIATKENAYPVIVWNDKDGKPVYAVGWQGLARFLKRYDASMGIVGSTVPLGPAGTSPAVPIPDSTPLPPPLPGQAPEPKP